MMHEFLTTQRAELIERCRRSVLQRHSPRVTEAELEKGIPLFLDQLILTLQSEQRGQPVLSRAVSRAAGGEGLDPLSEIGEGAAMHGRDLLRDGFTIEQVVHDYGDLCQAITGLAFETRAPMEIDEFRTLNRCLDNAIAAAVTEFNFGRDLDSQTKQAHLLNERLGFLAHEMRNLLNSASLAVAAIKAGHVGLGGATGAVLDRSLVGMRHLIEQSLTEVRTTAGIPSRRELLSLFDLVDEVKLTASLEAQMKECVFTASAVDPRLAVEGDRDMLFSAVENLLQNAFKFTRPHTEVTLTARAAGDHILIEVADHCGGLPPGDPEKMFAPFTQSGADKTGLGLGLSISRDSVRSSGGLLTVRDIPGTGCVFTIELPRRSLPEPQPIADRRAR